MNKKQMTITESAKLLLPSVQYGNLTLGAELSITFELDSNDTDKHMDEQISRIREKVLDEVKKQKQEVDELFEKSDFVLS